MSADLRELVEEWKTDLRRSLLTGLSTREFVNDSDHLDYESPNLSRLAARIHAMVKDRGRELETAAASCDSMSRESAFYLTSFAGDPHQYTAPAASRILDDDPAVSNAATRFLSVFADFIDATMAPPIAETACSSLDGGLSARNKSLQLLSKLNQARADVRATER